MLDVAVSGDPSGAVGLLHRHGPGLLAYCRWVLGDADDANDAVVDAIGALLASPPPPDASVSGHLHHLARIDCARRAAAQTRFSGDDRSDVGPDADPLAVATESLDHDDATLLFLFLRLGMEGSALAGAVDQAPERVPLRLDQLRERCGPELLAAAERSCDALPGIVGSGSPFAHEDGVDHVRACTVCEPALAALWRAGMLAPSVPEPTLVAGLEPAVVEAAPSAVVLAPGGAEPQRRSRRPAFVWLGGIAALILIGGAVAALALGGSDGDRSSDLVTSPSTPGSPSSSSGDAAVSTTSEGGEPQPDPTSEKATGISPGDNADPSVAPSTGGSRGAVPSSGRPPGTAGDAGGTSPVPTTPSTGSTGPAPSTTPRPSTTGPGATATSVPAGGSATTTTVRTGAPSTTTTTTTTSPPAQVSLAATIVDLDAGEGSSAVMLHNDGATSVPWTADATGSWSVSPLGGTLAPGASAPLTVSVDRAGLPEGVPATGTLSVTASGDTVTAALSAEVERPPSLVVAEIPATLKVKITVGCPGLVGRLGVDVADESGIASVVASWTAGTVNLNAAGGQRWQANLGPFFAEGMHDVTIVATDTRGNAASVVRQVNGVAC